MGCMFELEGRAVLVDREAAALRGEELVARAAAEGALDVQPRRERLVDEHVAVGGRDAVDLVRNRWQIFNVV